jgi:hypothetical protein
VALAPNPASPQVVGTTVLWTASATGCSAPTFRFSVFGTTGWTVVQDWSTSPTFSWNTTALAAGSFLVKVEARAAGATTVEATSPEIPFTLITTGSIAPCTSVALAANPASPQVIGTTVLFTATASGCSSPQFRFWLLRAGGSFSLVQDWSAGSTFSWNTTGLAAGDFTVAADARASSSGVFQASTQLAFTLTTTTPPSPCADQAKAIAFQVQRVNTAFHGFHTDLEKLRGLRDQAVLEKADHMLRLIRHSATKAIHATTTAACRKDDDEDENDNDEDDDDGDHDNDHQSSTSMSINIQNDDDHHDRRLGITFTGDAKAIADQAIAAMQVAFDAAKNAPAKTPKPTPTPRVENRTKPVLPTRSPDHKDGEHGDRD